MHATELAAVGASWIPWRAPAAVSALAHDERSPRTERQVPRLPHTERCATVCASVAELPYAAPRGDHAIVSVPLGPSRTERAALSVPY